MRALPYAVFLTLLAASLSAAEPKKDAPKKDEAPSPEALYAMTPEEFAKHAPAARHFSKDTLDIPLLEVAIFQQVNAERAKHKLPPLAYSRKLNAMARAHSQEMIKLSYFAHESPVKENRTLKDRLGKIHMPAAYAAAENIAMLPVYEMGSGTYRLEQDNGREVRIDGKTGKRLNYYTYLQFARENVAKWMNSKEHRENILDKRQKFQALGVARGLFHHQDSVMVTQNFASDIGPDDARFTPPTPPTSTTNPHPPGGAEAPPR